jgi:stress response protein YsnF
MSKTLVGLYDTHTEARQVVDALHKNNFQRTNIELVEPKGNGRGNGHTRDLARRLADRGMPEDDTHLYAEGVRRGGSLVLVEASEAQADHAREIMEQFNPIDVHERRARWHQEGWNRFDPKAAPYTETEVHQERERYNRRGVAAGAAGDVETTIPVVEEEVTVGKREVERGRVRIRTYTEERPVEKPVHLREEHVRVDRRPVDRPATEADFQAAAAETVEVTEMAEEAVVSKRARVVEEVVVRKDVDERTEMVRETARRTDVEVDEKGASRTADGYDFATYDADFRKHHTSNFSKSGMAYADYEPAYRYGYTLGTDPRYRGHEWATLEADARRDWETRHGKPWEQYRDAIHYGWNRCRPRAK